MEDLVGLVPVLLGSVAEQVDVVEIDRARHRAHLVIDVLGIRHVHDLPQEGGSPWTRFDVRPIRSGRRIEMWRLRLD